MVMNPRIAAVAAAFFVTMPLHAQGDDASLQSLAAARAHAA